MMIRGIPGLGNSVILIPYPFQLFLPETRKIEICHRIEDFNQISSVWAKSRYWQDILGLNFKILNCYLICFSLVNLNKLVIIYQNKSWLHTPFIKSQGSKRSNHFATVTLWLHRLQKQKKIKGIKICRGSLVL